MQDFVTIEESVEAPIAPGQMNLRQFLIETLQTILIALVLYLLIDAVVARVRVENISMEPTLVQGEFVLVNKLAYRFGEMRRGDIVVFHYPLDPDEDYIKRIIGLPGDNIEVHHGQVFVNDQGLDEEAYLITPTLYTGEWMVEDGTVFVLGDNRNRSSDSHDWGTVPIVNIVGKATLIYWPFTDITTLSLPADLLTGS